MSFLGANRVIFFAYKGSKYILKLERERINNKKSIIATTIFKKMFSTSVILEILVRRKVTRCLVGDVLSTQV